MKRIKYTKHAKIRMAQRGIKEKDADIVLAYGTSIGRNRYFLKKRAAAREIGYLKQKIAQFERLKDKVVVVVDDHLITAYHSAEPIR